MGLFKCCLSATANHTTVYQAELAAIYQACKYLDQHYNTLKCMWGLTLLSIVQSGRGLQFESNWALVWLTNRYLSSVVLWTPAKKVVPSPGLVGTQLWSWAPVCTREEVAKACLPVRPRETPQRTSMVPRWSSRAVPEWVLSCSTLSCQPLRDCSGAAGIAPDDIYNHL